MKEASYVAHKLDASGKIPWTPEEDKVWEKLYTRQIETIKGRACQEFIDGLDKLKLAHNRCPQIDEVSEALRKETGWAVEAVNAVIPADEFFTLLANKKFPAATFIRRMDELDYLKEPDIFHEVFGHCPLLTIPEYADFMESYGKLALQLSPKERRFLFRVFWFTIEFGLLKTSEGVKIYGGGILSSHKETIMAVQDNHPAEYADFDIKTTLRTPFRIDIVQPLYFILDGLDKLSEVLKPMDRIIEMVKEAIELGDFDPKFEYEPGTGGKNDRYN